ncbi:hypothetical protein MSHO_58070 [Mycobacterium shottsii]|uniref:Acyl-CoA dehydrogenase/oxidase N-terminal domain-containing protein n=1 Tax=Mycobacterium shottsii TaxID=133549 RepID=A0A7I7LLU0_9MYCO|nr:hypothetical protein MSHO_58070 [Mycobacterium shottsii]
MDFRDSPQEAVFRQRLRNWLSVNADDFRGSGDQYWARQAHWHQALYREGFFGLSWPREYGGRELAPVYDVIVDEELARAGAPPRPSVGTWSSASADTAATHCGNGFCPASSTGPSAGVRGSVSPVRVRTWPR